MVAGPRNHLHQGAQDLAGLEARCLDVIPQRAVESVDLFPVERRHLGMEQRWRAFGIGQLPLKFRLSTFELDHLCVDGIREARYRQSPEADDGICLGRLGLVKRCPLRHSSATSGLNVRWFTKDFN
jgi:hypothetical protein